MKRKTYDEGRAPHPVGTHGMISFCKPVDFARYGQAGMNKI